jgi:hypothetical protein
MAMPKLFGEMNSNRENEGNLDHMISQATVKCRHAREGGNLEIATGRRGHRMAQCTRVRARARRADRAWRPAPGELCYFPAHCRSRCGSYVLRVHSIPAMHTRVGRATAGGRVQSPGLL